MEFATPLLCFYDKAGLAVSKKSETNESLNERPRKLR